LDNVSPAADGDPARCGPSDCGGATCHIYVDQDWFAKLAPPSDSEVDVLDMAVAVEPNSRLSCQITCTPELDGIKVTIAPE
jgi:2Fe-2S ferredoxin